MIRCCSANQLSKGTHLVKKVFWSSRWVRYFSGQGMQAVILNRRMGTIRGVVPKRLDQLPKPELM